MAIEKVQNTFTSSLPSRLWASKECETKTVIVGVLGNCYCYVMFGHASDIFMVLSALIDLRGFQPSLGDSSPETILFFLIVILL